MNTKLKGLLTRGQNDSDNDFSEGFFDTKADNTFLNDNDKPLRHTHICKKKLSTHFPSRQKLQKTIVAFFPFSGALCMESRDKEMQLLVSQITTWMATYLNDYLEPWIQDNGGWDTFVELYGNNTATESPKGQEHFNHWSLTGITVTGMVLLGLLVNS